MDLFHKSHNASVSYPTMHHFVTEMCTYVVHFGIWEIGILVIPGLTRWPVGYLNEILDK